MQRRAKAFGETITGPASGKGPYELFQERQKLEARLTKEGKRFDTDPEWRQLVKDQARAGSAADTSTATWGAGMDIVPVGEGIARAAGGAARGIGKVATGAKNTVKNAISGGAERLEAEASHAAEALRGRASKEVETQAATKEQQIGETREAAQREAQATEAAAGAEAGQTEEASRAAADQFEADIRAEANRATAEHHLAQGRLDAANKAIDDDVAADLKRVKQLTNERAKPEAPSKTPQLPQYLRGKPIEGAVPARASAAPKQRIQGLSGEIEQRIRAAQQKVRDHASRLYTMATKTAGEAKVPTTGLKETIQKFMDSLPEDVKMTVSPVLRNLAYSDQESMTVQELQNLRTTLRSLGDNPKLTPDLKSGPYRLLANKADQLLHLPGNPREVKDAVRIIDSADKFYARNMRQFQSQTLQKIADDVRDGLPMDASKVLDLAARSGESGTLKRIVNIGGNRVRLQLRNADLDNLMSAAKEPGTDNIDPKKFLKGVEDRQKDGRLETLYGNERRHILNLAQKLAAREGTLPASEIKPGRFRILARHVEELKGRTAELAKRSERAAAGVEKAQTGAEAQRAKGAAEAEKIRTRGATEAERTRATGETKAQALDSMKKDLRGWTAQLKSTSTSPEDVAAKTDTIADGLYRKGLLSKEHYEDYLKRVKDVRDKYAASKKALADRRAARRHLLLIGRSIFEVLGLWTAGRLMLELYRSL
ncbi:MAG TPA: hypothetical protein VMU69_22775 [Bradyrhizobium sp.]|nr:hypothetical protein [Bradyrhizobium sp.]